MIPVSPHLTLYGGVGEIGGNKVLLEDRDTKIFLDFGAGFSDGAAYYSSGIEPRGVNGLGDYFEFGMLPKISGLYSEDMLSDTELRYTEPEIDAILLSHFHSDHAARIKFVDPKIPVYCGETTGLFHDAYSESTGSPLERHKLITFRTGERKKIGSVEIIPIHVDHSIPGAYGFIIHTSEGTLAYTGDFRFHGPKGGMTEEFASEALRAHPDYLITEGTRVTKDDSKQDLSEVDVFKKTADVLSRCKKLAFSTFRGNDIDRINSFYAACKKTDRTLVISMKTAILLEKLQKDRNLRIPRVGKDVSVFIRRKKSGNYDDKDYFTWERNFLGQGITCEDIKKNQSGVFLHLDMWNLPEMIDIKPERGGAYIHASSEAFNEEGESEEVTIKNWIEHFGFSYNQIHASGHAPGSAVATLVNKIGAKSTIPIHTEHPELFPSMLSAGSAIIPEKGKRMELNRRS